MKNDLWDLLTITIIVLANVFSFMAGIFITYKAMEYFVLSIGGGS